MRHREEEKIKEENADSIFRIQTRIINKRKWTVRKDKDKDGEGNSAKQITACEIVL